MKLRLKAAVAMLIAAGSAMAVTVPITLTAPEGSGLTVAYDEATNVYTLTAGPAGQKRTVRTNELEAPFDADIRYLKFDYTNTSTFIDINVTLYKCGSKGTSTQTRTFTGTFTANGMWNQYHYDARALRRVNSVKLGNNAGQYQDFEFTNMPEGAVMQIRDLRWAADQEVYTSVSISPDGNAVVEAEDFNKSISEETHASRQLEYPDMTPYKNPTGDRFPVYAWGSLDYKYKGIEDGLDLGMVRLKEMYKEMSECGFTCTQGTAWPAIDQAALFPGGNGGNGSVPVDLFEDIDMWMIVKAGTDNEPEIAETYKNAPRLAGYFIYDEPHFMHFPSMRGKLLKLKQYDDQHIFYGNLLNIGTDMKAIGATSYEHYVQEFIRQVGTGFLSFDYYPVRRDDTSGKIFLKQDYFKNLEIVSKMSKYYKIPFWSFGHSVASNCGTPNESYPTPTEDHLRVQVFLSLAYGAQGIQYFTYQRPNSYGGYDYYDAPIDFDDSKTPVWYAVQAVNKDIHAMTNVFLGAEMLRVGLTHATTPVGCVRLTPDMLPEGVTSVTSDGIGLCVSVLQNGTRQYLMIVNPDIDNSQNVTVGLSAKIKRVISDDNITAVEGEQNVTLVPGGHLVYLVDENAPVAEEYEQPAPFDRANYRTDAADVIISADESASGGHFLPEMGDRAWNLFAGVLPDDANHTITEDMAIRNWGSIYNYYINADEDMDVDITVGHSVPWSEYGRVAVTGATPGYGYMVENNPTLNWPKAYAASMILEIDGVAVTPSNQPLRPAVPELFDPAGAEFNRILADQGQWVSTKKADGTPSDVLYFWPKEGGSDAVDFVYREQPDYASVHLTAGEHKIVVKSMSYPWHFDALKIATSTGAGIGSVGTDESSEIVSSQYFDLQGRCLQGEPESGLYLRRDLRANGTSTTVKVVK